MRCTGTFLCSEDYCLAWESYEAALYCIQLHPSRGLRAGLDVRAAGRSAPLAKGGRDPPYGRDHPKVTKSNQVAKKQ